MGQNVASEVISEHQSFLEEHLSRLPRYLHVVCKALATPLLAE